MHLTPGEADGEEHARDCRPQPDVFGPGPAAIRADLAAVQPGVHAAEITSPHLSSIISQQGGNFVSLWFEDLVGHPKFFGVELNWKEQNGH